MSRIIDVIMQAESIRLRFLETVTANSIGTAFMTQQFSGSDAVQNRTGEMHVGDLTLAGSSRHKRLLQRKEADDAGYLACRRPESDRRVGLVRVAEKGAKVQDSWRRWSSVTKG